MISVDKLIMDLAALHIDHREVFVEVQVDVDGKPHRAPLGAMELFSGASRLTLVADPAPTPEPVVPHLAVHPDGTVVQNVAKPEHAHSWARDSLGERWRCVGMDCFAVVTYEEIFRYPAPANEEEAFALLDALASGLS